MMNTIFSTATIKAILGVCAVMLLGGLYQEGQQTTVLIEDEHTADPFVQDIQARSDLVYNAVMEAHDQQGIQQPITYKQTCESSLAFIQGERLDTNDGYNTLDAEQKEVIDEYRAYLKEAANVVVSFKNGEQPDLTEMIRLKNELY